MSVKLEVGKYRKIEEDGSVKEYWVNEIFDKTAHVDFFTCAVDDFCQHLVDKSCPIWLIEEEIQKCEKYQ